ncbi:MAG TPA: DUF3224 domain-containing protein [Ktedonobacterales bacterium]|jgi:hypothetical protein|nr:DUF3224 domain-containing protein [Ktedonobacterales bacterium]
MRGRLRIDTWEDEHSATNTFSGEIAGSSAAALVMAGAQEGFAAYVGLEQVVASVHGRSGSFVLQHSATMTKDAQSRSLTVVPDSGTGELLGLRGEARSEIDADGGHTLILDYELG